MTKMTYSAAVAQTLERLMREDDKIIIVYPGIGAPPPFGVPKDLHHRGFAMPIAELGYGGVATGAAVAGMKPLVNFGIGSWMFQAWAQVVNEAPQYYYTTGGEIEVPIVFHIASGIRSANGSQHSHNVQGMLWNTPGLQITMPSTAADVKGMLPSMFASPNPTFFISHSFTDNIEWEVPDEDYVIPLGKADVKREGKDVTIIASSIMVHRALEAAETLEKEHRVSTEVVDIRSLVPLDKETIFNSVAKTGRVVVGDEGHRSNNVASGISSFIVEEIFDALKAPIKIVSPPDVCIPYSPPMEAFIRPTADKLVASVLSIL
jgi:pyruvate dehydrogenase E1 component beta subunit